MEYNGEKYKKTHLIGKQVEYVSQLREILKESGANPFYEKEHLTSASRVNNKEPLRITVGDNSSMNDDETQFNSEIKQHPASSGGISKNMQAPSSSA